MTVRETDLICEREPLFPERVRARAAGSPCRPALVHVDERGRESERVTYGTLVERALRGARRLSTRFAPGERALLAIDAPIDCLSAFLACHYAALVPVPVLPPRRNKVHAATAGIEADCQPVCILTSRRHAPAFGAIAEGAGRPSVVAAEDLLADEGGGSDPRQVSARDLALLQYTSGSTSDPKGVVVSHGNLRINLWQISRTMRTGPESRFVSWIPLFHDMGLILTALQALSVGGTCVFMTPAAFSQRPLLWLRLISDYRADIAGAPDFAYDLCIRAYDEELARGLDLSSWTIAFNAAEPVRAGTMERFGELFARHGFDPAAFYPCYGLAECTVFASGEKPKHGVRTLALDREALTGNRVERARSGGQVLLSVACGSAIEGVGIRIVDPDTREALGERDIGEIWIQGPNIAQGYWRKPEASAATFRARIKGEEDAGTFLRTGDQGFLDEGRVHVTGRLKDVMIIRGRNIHPQDVEKTVEAAHEALRASCSAAFVVGRDEDPMLVVAAEVERTWRSKADPTDIVGAARAAVAAEFDLRLHDLVLLKTGSIPKTTSGKLRRIETRNCYLSGTLTTVGAPGMGPAVAESVGE